MNPARVKHLLAILCMYVNIVKLMSIIVRPSTDCYIMVHRHCEDRVPPCKAHIESGSYVTMSRNKVVKKLEDLDNLGQFLLEKVEYLLTIHVRS